jgi:hypothetical protein
MITNLASNHLRETVRDQEPGIHSHVINFFFNSEILALFALVPPYYKHWRVGS